VSACKAVSRRVRELEFTWVFSSLFSGCGCLALTDGHLLLEPCACQLRRAVGQQSAGNSWRNPLAAQWGGQSLAGASV